MLQEQNKGLHQKFDPLINIFPQVNQRGVDGCSALVKACYERPDIG